MTIQLQPTPIQPSTTSVSEVRHVSHDPKRGRDLELAAREFEQIFVRAMLKGTPIGQNNDAYGDLAVEAMAKSVTQGRGLGLGEMIRRTLEKSQSAPPRELSLKVSDELP